MSIESFEGENMDGTEKKVSPECGHVFAGNGWDGIDAHSKSKHEHVMPYEKAWPLIQHNQYEKASGSGVQSKTSD